MSSQFTRRIKTLSARLLATVVFLQGNAYAASAEDVLAPLRRSLADLPVEKAPRAEAVQKLLDQADTLIAAHPGEARFLVWKGAISAELAGINRNLQSLGLVKETRELFAAAEKLDPAVLDWSNYNLLGYLYENVPGWPIGFGDEDEADRYFRKAIELNPTGAGSHYDYGRFLLGQEEFAAAARELEFALTAPLRVGETQPEPGVSCRAYVCVRYTEEGDAAFRARIQGMLDAARKELE